MSFLILYISSLLLLLLALQPTVGFSLLSDFLPFRPFLTQLSPPSYSHYLYIFFDVLNPSFPWSSSVTPTYCFAIECAHSRFQIALPYPYPCFVIEIVFVRAVRFPSLNSSQHFSFSGAELSALRPSRNLEDQGTDHDQGISLSLVSLLEHVWLGWPYQKLELPPA